MSYAFRYNVRHKKKLLTSRETSLPLIFEVLPMVEVADPAAMKGLFWLAFEL